MNTDLIMAVTIFLSLVLPVLVRPFVVLLVRALPITRRPAAVRFAALIILIGIVGCDGGSPAALSPIETTTAQDVASVEILFFWSGACATCSFSEEGQREAIQGQRSQQARLILDDLSVEYPELEILSFEVTYHPENRELLESLAESLEITVPSVPMVFIGSAYWTMFGEETMHEMKACVAASLDRGYSGDDALTCGE